MEPLPDKERFLPKADERVMQKNEVVAFFMYAFGYSESTFENHHRCYLQKFAHADDDKNGRVRRRVHGFYESQVVATIRDLKEHSKPEEG